MERNRNDAEMERGARPIVVPQPPARVAMFAQVLLAGIVVVAACVPASEPGARASLKQAWLPAFASTGNLPAGADTRQSVAVVEPSQVGLDPQRLARVDNLIRAAIADSVTPGAALAIGRRGRLVRLQGYGHLDWADGSPPVTDSSLYDLASLTKIVGTATALMILTERGSVDLDAPVSRYLPWWRGGGKGAVTIRQLLLHRAGLPPFRPFWRELRGRDEYARGIAALRVVYPPGDSTVYSDIGFMALGFVVEAVTGDALDTFVRRT
ncbi:MAG: beta-lactamase family protein, partial [Gemmatimonadetes bacterium]|nr:beta-lactamase family protein [Gemmatimonadota bacterium]